MSVCRRSVPRELQPAFDLALALGWRTEALGSGHLRWVPPEGRFVVTSSTPSDGRGVRNALAMLRRAGLPLPR
jgi:hypothetical protein